MLVMSVAAPVEALSQPGSSPNYDSISSQAVIGEMEELQDLGILHTANAMAFQMGMISDEICYSLNGVLENLHGCSFLDTDEIAGLKEKALAGGYDENAENDKTWYVNYMEALGIYKQKAPEYNYFEKVTRENTAGMLYRFLDVSTSVVKDLRADNKDGVNPVFLPHIFKDSKDISRENREAVNVLYHLGILSGDSESFRPDDEMTREEFYRAVLRLYYVCKAPGKVTRPEPELYPSADNMLYGDHNGRYRLDAPYMWVSKDYTYEPIYYDGAGNSYTAAEKGYVYPVGNDYMQVVTSVGAGVGRSIFIGKDKQQIGPDFSQIDGFTDDKAYGFSANYAPMAVDLKTGEVTDEYDGDPFANFRNEGFVINGWYLYDNGGGSYEIRNVSGEKSKSVQIDTGRYEVTGTSGTNMILNDSLEKGYVLLRVYSNEYIRGYSYMKFTDKGDIIAKDSKENYFLLDKNGEVLIDAAALGFDYISAEEGGEYIHACDINKTNWSYCAPFKILDRNGKEIIDLGTGHDIDVYDGIGYVAKSPNEIDVFDTEGVLGRIVTDVKMVSTDPYKYINGLVNVRLENGEYRYYTIYGEEAVRSAWTTKEEDEYDK